MLMMDFTENVFCDNLQSIEMAEAKSKTVIANLKYSTAIDPYL